MENVSVIFNPIAGGRDGETRLKKLVTQLDQKLDRKYRIQQTKAPGDGITLSREATERGCDLLIVAGGDGTINEVVNGIMKASARTQNRPDLGIVNIGSGADFARTLKLPRKISDQLALIFEAPVRSVDVGLVKCADESGNIIERYFVNECQIGIGGQVVANMGTSKKKLGGSLDFALAAMKQLLSYRATKIELRVEGDGDQSGKMLGIVFANGAYSAGGMKMAPGAKINDKFLDMLCMRDMGIADRFITFGKVYFGSHVTSKFARYQQVKTADLHTSNPVWVEADGELIGTTPCEISIIPGAISIRY